jgi:hypothetical protein
MMMIPYYANNKQHEPKKKEKAKKVEWLEIENKEMIKT